MMIVQVYLSFVVPLAFLLLVVTGEGRGVIASFAFGMSAALAVYGLTGFISEAVVTLPLQLAFVIPAIEEVAKVLPLVYLLLRSKKTGKYSLVRYAMAIGIGFSILENYMYLNMAADSGVSSTIVFTLLRSLTASLLHGSTTALSGFCLQLMVNRSRFSPALALGTLLGGCAVHSLYNALLLNAENGAWAIVLPIASFGFVLFGINGFGIVGAPRSQRKEGAST